MARSFPLFACSFVLMLCGGTADAAPLDATTRDFDQLHLDLRVVPDLATGTVEGEVRLRLASVADPLRQVRLHSMDTVVLSVREADAEALPWRLEGDVLTVDLAEPLPRGTEMTLAVEYRSTPRAGLHFHRPTDRHPKTPWFLYSQGQGNENRRWIPCYDLPDDRLTWDVHVTVKDAFDTVSNGTLVERAATGEGTRTDHWSFPFQSPTYLLSLIVADLETVEDRWRDVKLEYSAVPGYAEQLRTSLGDTPRMMEFFSSYLDAPYPWPRYAQTYVWDFVYGGMENTTATTLNMRALHLPAARPNYMSEGLVAHELAHMWFGDWITCRTWDGIWLNEGFATYFTDLYFEHRDGRDAFLLRRREQNEGYMEGTPNAANLELKRDPRGDKPMELFGGKQYNRGAAILHMLRLELGDETFRDGLREYVRRNQDRTVTSEDLRRAVETVAGRDLQWFFDQWVYGAGYPTLDVRRQGGRLTIRQAQDRRNGQGLFRLTVPVRAGANGVTQQVRLWRESHDVEVDKDAPYVRVGGGGDLLVRVRFDQGAAAALAMLASDPEVAARLDAIQVLEAGGDDATAAFARALGADAHWAVRQAAAEALAPRDADPAAGAALLAAVKDPDPRVRETVLEALGRRGRDEVEAALLEALASETHDYPRAAAARSLGKTMSRAAYAALEKLLALDSHGDVVRQGALEGLGALGDPRGADLAAPFTDYAWSRGSNHRLPEAALACVLKLAPDHEATHRLVMSLFEDPHPGARRRAAEAAGTYLVHAARGGLERLEREDRDGSVKQAARRALDRLDGKE
jgi:aminopeptidase N